MRLLERNDTGEFRLTDDLPNDKIPPYAILSHTWGNEEVSFKDFANGMAKNKAGYAKIQFCGDQARYDALEFFWVDTCCIDKSDSAELQNALNSMFRWYRNAAKCYVYLTDVSACKRDVDGNSSWEFAFQNSRWFTRGWTLQELIAPMVVEFFSKERKRLGDKKSLAQHIHNITGIPLRALQGNTLSDFSTEARMSWVKERNTTRKEDKAYSLFGIFDVCMPLLYGEGEDRALERLREEISKHDRHLANLHSTDPHLDKMRIEEAKGGLLTDAYRWVLATPDFRRWYDEPESPLLWIKGDPGKGKTMLLCGIINELERAIFTDGHCRNLAYFFCQATDSRINNAIAVLRGLVYLLAHQQPRLISHLRKYTDAGKSISDANAWFALSDIFGGMLGDPNLKQTYVVIDALDECIDDLPRLLKFIVGISSTLPRVKWIVSSRNWPNIEENLEAAEQKIRLSLELNEESISSAVSTYIQHKVDELARLKRYDDNTKNAVQHHLTCTAHDTFLWVALVCQELTKFSRSRVLTKLNTFPPGLGSLYQRMIHQIRHSDEADLCKQVLAILSITYRPITIQELTSFVDIPKGLSDDVEFMTEIVGLCGSFLTLRETTIYFIHQSAKDFLLKDAFDEIFPSGLEPLHSTVFSTSLHIMSGTLRRDIYGLCVPGFPIENVNPPDPDPLITAHYACVYWVDHLYDWQSSDNTKQPDVFQDGGTIDDFLRQHYLHWLEALSLCRSMSQGILSMAKLESLLQQRTIASKLPSLVRDMRRFVLYCRWLVENHPLQVYASALVFSPARSMTRDLFKQEESRWITTGPVVEDDWNACQQTLEGHSDSVSSVAFSPDSKLVASGSRDQTVKIWDAATGSYMQTLEGHSCNVSSVTFLPDSKLIISGSEDWTVKIWDMATGSCTQTLKGHSDYVSSITFLPDLKLIASGSWDQTVKIWDMATGSCAQTLKGHSSGVSSITFSPDSKLIISGSEDWTIKIWDMATGSCTQTLKGHSGGVSSITFSPGLKLIASGSWDQTIKIWDMATGSCTQTLKGHSGGVSSITFSPDSKLVASGSLDCTIKIWDVVTGLCTQTLEGHSNYVSSVTFSPDSKLIVSGSEDFTVKIWDVVTGLYTQTLEGHSDYVSSITFSPDSKLIASGSGDQTVKIWDAATGLYTQTLEGHSDYVSSITFSPNSKLIASGSGDQTVKIWDAATGLYTQTLEGHSHNVSTFAFSPDSKLIASGSGDQTVKIWDVATGQTLEGHSHNVSTFAFSPDSKLIASGSEDFTVKIWDVATGLYMQTLKGHSHSVSSIAFSPDLKLVTSGSGDQTVKIWDMATGSCIQTLKGHSGGVSSVAFSPDSKLIVSGSWDQTVKIWDTVTGSCTQTLEGHSGGVSSIAFSPDSKLVMSRSWWDYTVKIWDAAAGSCTQTLKGHSSDVTSSKLFTSWSRNRITPYPQDYRVDSDGRWIMRGLENWLWLPPGCRPICSAVAASTVAIGCSSGRVLIITLPTDN
ncbi:quinon protein alcohol dehydrogenase-like superfamily [Lasiosphaeria hispida]|uniref:Quinon protein alcohol dehydrogenase-like superfamily n=1 Tax=Lasiosphaeria hispida TaxID=260671 RepID=A0AAJ0MBJ6_9PEZI|nr:quinon protein alcohol dehydrogenase-like superfamily [Lasiosphaeria hispida]